MGRAPRISYEKIKQEIPYKVNVYVPDGMNHRGEWYDLKCAKSKKAGQDTSGIGNDFDDVLISGKRSEGGRYARRCRRGMIC